MKKYSTKRAFIVSLLTLCLSFTMLLGTTYAWFTDSVSSTGNVIKSGTLDVGFYWAEGTEAPASANWTDAKDGAIFKNDLWEPGYAETKHIKITNEGTLSLAYKLAIIPHGQVSELADVIEVYYVVGATELDDRTDLDSKYIGTLRDLIKNGIAAGTLEAKDKGQSEYTATIVLKMAEEAGNEYQNLSIGSDFSIQLLATQNTSEKDSFDNQYDKNAYFVVNNVAELRTAIAQALDTTTIFVQAGDYEVDGVITMSDKEITIVGLGVVNFVKASDYKSHIFNIADDSVVTIKNINMDGNGFAKNGVFVRNNSTVTLDGCYVGNTGGKDVIIDEASDAAHGKNTTSTVNLVNSHIEDFAMCASPSKNVPAATQNTYAKFNFDAESSVYYVQIDDHCIAPQNCYVNGSNINANYTFYVANDEQLDAALADIEGNSLYYKQTAPVVIKLADGNYSGDHVINQYVDPNGNNTDYANKYLNIQLVGSEKAVFTGNVYVYGSGYSGGGFGNHTATTTFTGVTFDAANSVEDNGEDYAVVNVYKAASNVNFVGCTFLNATHVNLGGSGATNGVGAVNFDNCYFNNGGCLSGYYETLNVTETTVVKADNGFINNNKASTITVDDCDVTCAKYFVRLNNTGHSVMVTDTKIAQTDLANDKGTGLVVFQKASTTANTVEFYGDNIAYETLVDGLGTGFVRINGKTADGKYAAYNADTLVESLENAVNGGEVVLLQDINLAGANWTPIGSDSAPFKGVLNGNGKTISGLTVSDVDYAALIYVADNGAVIKNLNLANVNISANKYAAGVVVHAEHNATIENVTVSGNIYGKSYAGGIAMDSYAITLTNCVNNATVTAQRAAGIIAWTDEASVIDNCVNNGDITGAVGASGIANRFVGTMSDSTNNGDITANGNEPAGGLVSIQNGSSTYVNCVNYGDVKSTADNANASAAGILGQNPGSASTLTNCSNYGDITAEQSYAAGIAYGMYSGGIVANYCYNEGDVFGGDCAGGISPKPQYGAVSTANYCVNKGQVTSNGQVYELAVTVNNGGYKMIANGLGVVEGTKNYYVFTGAGLKAFNDMMAAQTAGAGCTLTLANDIDFAGYTWTTVDSHVDSPCYISKIDGQNHTISNLTINGQAMFRRFAGAGTVEITNLTFDGANVNSNGAINTSILTVQSYQNLVLDNVDVKNSTIIGGYKVAALVGTVYNESSSTVTATVKNCDIDNCTIKSTKYDYFTCGIVAFVNAGDNDAIVFENTTISNTTISTSATSYNLHAFIYCTTESNLVNEAAGVTVTNCKFEKVN